jgi:hypothetical protein
MILATSLLVLESERQGLLGSGRRPHVKARRVGSEGSEWSEVIAWSRPVSWASACFAVWSGRVVVQNERALQGRKSVSTPRLGGLLCRSSCMLICLAGSTRYVVAKPRTVGALRPRQGARQRSILFSY